MYPSLSPKGLFKFTTTFIRALLLRKKNSLIFIQKVCTNRLYANALKLLVLLRIKNTIYDIDDAEYYRTDPKTLHFFIKNCTKITVGSAKLLEYCSTLNDNVHLSTSPVLPHNNRKTNREKIFTIGWVGDAGNGDAPSHPFSHKTSLYKLLFTAISQISFQVKLVLIGIKNPNDIADIYAYFEPLPNITLEIPTGLNWEDDSWLYHEITKFDVGISPMVDHPFNQSKSAFKAKQYLSCGIPVIASDVGETDKFVEDNYNGVLCDSPKDFKNAITRFSKMNDTEYSLFSANCIKGIKNYSVDRYCKRLIDIVTVKEETLQ